MANLIGPGISQLPTNGMLGNLAFQDKAYVSVDKVGIGSTFVDSGTAGQNLQVRGGAYIDGNVGVGTTNPGTNLHVQGNTWLNNLSGDTITRAQGLTVSFAPGVNWTPGTDPGDLLRNTTFVVKGSTRAAIITLRNIDNGNAFYDLIADGNSNSFYIQRPGTSPALTIRNDNNIGIGTTNPGARLQITPTSTGIAGLFSGTTSSDMVRITQLGSGNALVVEDETNPDATPFVVTASGNVGIGTTNPTSRLTVSGNALITGVITSTSFTGDGSSLTGIPVGDLYELDQISPAGGENTYTPTFNYDTVSVTDPFRLLITIDGILQSAYVHNTEYVFNNSLLTSRTGYTIDYDGRIKFTESLSEGSEVMIKTTAGTTKSTARRYPFNALDVLF